MRVFVIKEDTDLAGLSARLLNARDASGARAAADGLKALNPHVDFTRLAAGTVLLLPDTPGLKQGAGTSLGGATFEAFAKDVDSGFTHSSGRIKQGFERLSAERTAVSAVLKTAAMKRLIESNPALKKQLNAVDAKFKDGEKTMLAARKLLDNAQKQAIEELAGLAKLFE